MSIDFNKVKSYIINRSVKTGSNQNRAATKTGLIQNRKHEMADNESDHDIRTPSPLPATPPSTPPRTASPGRTPPTRHIPSDPNDDYFQINCFVCQEVAKPGQVQ